MDNKDAVRARHDRQARVAKAVWGLFLVGLGVVFTLENLGMMDLGDQVRHQAAMAVDGNARTRWSSTFSDPQWITLDLGASSDITRVRLNWEKACATAYRIETSEDGSSFTTVKEVTDGKGGLDEHETSARGRYVRIYGTQRATPWGYSLYELEVYGTKAAGSSPVLLSRNQPATASSTETHPELAWFVFWPMLLIAGGLPLILAPKDPGEQVFGLILAGVGVFFQLQTLRIISWDFGRVWPFLLVAAGLLLVLQGLRPRDAGPGASFTPGGGAGSGGGRP